MSNSLLGALLIGVAVHSVLPFGQRAPEKFVIRHDIPTKGLSFDPNPKWVNVPWESKADQPFALIRREVTEAVGGGSLRDSTKTWQAKLKRAYDEWYVDHQNPVKLFRVSAYLAAVKSLDPEFSRSKDFSTIDQTSNLGWSMLRECPHSYEFCRRAYLQNAGDNHFHQCGDLGIRLIERDPLDRSVAVQMVFDYEWKKPNVRFEEAMFSALNKIKEAKLFRPIDFYHLGLAYRLYGLKHSSKRQYEFALQNVERAITALKKSEDVTWLVKFRKETVLERDRLQARPKGFKWLEDGKPGN